MSSKSIVIISSYIVSKWVHFLRHSVQVAATSAENCCLITKHCLALQVNWHY